MDHGAHVDYIAWRCGKPWPTELGAERVRAGDVGGVTAAAKKLRALCFADAGIALP